jgi:hypothetical protein
MITRRNFIEMLGLTTVGGVALMTAGKALGQALTSDDLFALPAESLADPVMSFTSAHFTPFIDTRFEARQAGSDRVEQLILLNVKEVSRKANVAKGVNGDSFSLMFSNARAAKMSEAQFELTHPALGTFKLNLVPVSAEPNRYEAVINHLRKA